jgi:transposase
MDELTGTALHYAHHPFMIFQKMTQGTGRMKIESIDGQATVETAQLLVRDDKQLSAAAKSMFEILILIITWLANRLNLDGTNSSKPPSRDSNRKKQPREKTGKKAGGQNVL